ncbi:MAG: HEAT repeat domain-containing protein [Calditrichaeota bacterium]|nr:HEAT repeat domain-containing protein [Calditrichota bacterium]
MENHTVKDLIDRLLIDDLDTEELRTLTEQIADNPEMMAYYERTLKIKNELSKLSEEEAFSGQELDEARQRLFSGINTPANNIYSIWQLAVAALIGAGLTAIAILGLSGNKAELIGSNSNLINVSVEQDANNNYVISGKQVTDFTVSGDINNSQVQHLLLKTINQSNNLGSRINAINFLTKSQNKQILNTFIDIAMNDPSIALRLKAIESLEPHLTNESVQKGLIQIVQTDSNDIVRIAAFNQLNNLPLNKETQPVFKDLVEKNKNEYIRQTALKRIIKGEI